ncbi:unnamed protein product [Colias eurytheme]|nr:unnamed protein product [Colias eurytheme]
MGHEKKALWRCLTCRGGLSPTPSQPSDSSSLLEVIKEIKEFRADFVIMQRDVVSIKEELSSTSQVITQLQSKWNALEKRFTDMEERLVNVEGTVASLMTVSQQLTETQQTVNELVQDINYQNQFSRLNNIEIQGVPQTTGENLYNILGTICTMVAGPASSVHINEHLTPTNKQLLKKARDIKFNLNYTYLWIRDCKIFLRKNDKSKVVRIANESDLLKLK